MNQRRVWILLALFAALAGYALYLKYKPEAPAESEEEPTPSATLAPVEFLFPSNEGNITSLRIESQDGQVIRVDRQKGEWVVTRPHKAAADQASVEAAASQVAALTVTDHLEDVSPDVVGLESPAYTIEVGFSGGKSLVVQVGETTPTGTGYYVRKEDGSILVIERYGMDALLNLHTYPPFLATPTPTSTLPPTETPIPAAETPTATKTP